MGIFSNIVKSVGSKIGEKISESIDSTPVGKFLHEDNSSLDSSELPYVSENITELEINLNKKLGFDTLDPTTFWDSGDNFGACEITTVFAFSPGGAPLERTSDSELPDGLIVFESANTTIHNETEAQERVKHFDNNLNTKVLSLSNDLFKFIVSGESEEKYIELCYMEYEYDGSTYEYEIYLDINKKKFINKQMQLMKLEFHTMTSSMTMSDL